MPQASQRPDPAAGPDPHPLPRPLHCDWAWRPAPWVAPLSPAVRDDLPAGEEIAPGISLHHDATSGRIGYRQLATPAGTAPHALRLEAVGLAAGYVSLAIALPEAGTLRRRHVLALHLGLDPAHQADAFARLNIRHGPNTARMTEDLPATVAPDRPVEFDLGFCEFNDRRVSHAWCDVILGGFAPGTSFALTVIEAAFTRRPRFEI